MPSWTWPTRLSRRREPGFCSAPLSAAQVNCRCTSRRSSAALGDIRTWPLTIMVGDRGMITAARIDALREHPGLGWLTALRAPAIAKLAADNQPLQLSLFDEQDLAEITHPDYPGERLIACRNPALAEQRARKREELLTATETAQTKTPAS